MDKEIRLRFSTTADNRLRVFLATKTGTHAIESPKPEESTTLTETEDLRAHIIPIFLQSLCHVLRKEVYPEHTPIFAVRNDQRGGYFDLGYPDEVMTKCDGNHALHLPECIDKECWLADENPFTGATPL